MVYQRSLIFDSISSENKISLTLFLHFSSHNLWKMVKQANNTYLNYTIQIFIATQCSTPNLSRPQWYRYSRTIFFPFESPRNRYANSYPLDRGLSAESYKLALLARTNLSPYFHSLSPPPPPLFPSSFPPSWRRFLLWYPIIGYLERRSGSTGQPIRASNSCCRCYLKDNEKDSRQPWKCRLRCDIVSLEFVEYCLILD